MEEEEKFVGAGVSLEEFIAFQLFLDNIDRLKSKLHQFKFLDYDMYREEFDRFSANNQYCLKNKVAITDA